MSEAMQMAILGAVFNGAVTWGIVSTKLAWLRRDVDKLDTRVTACEEKHHASHAQHHSKARA